VPPPAPSPEDHPSVPADARARRAAIGLLIALALQLGIFLLFYDLFMNAAAVALSQLATAALFPAFLLLCNFMILRQVPALLNGSWNTLGPALRWQGAMLLVAIVQLGVTASLGEIGLSRRFGGVSGYEWGLGYTIMAVLTTLLCGLSLLATFIIAIRRWRSARRPAVAG
jgi:hypothetical protein